MEVNKDKVYNFQLEYIKFSLTLLLTITTLIFTASFIQSHYNPDISPSLKMAEEVLLMPQGAKPEPKEKTIFMASVLVGVLSLVGYFSFINYFLNKKKSEIFEKMYPLFIVLNVFLLLFLTYLCFAAPNPFASVPQNSHDIIGKTNFDFYFIKSFIHNKPFIYVIILFPIIAFLFLYNFKFPTSSEDNFNKFSSKFSLLFCLLLSLLTIGFCAFKFPYTWENKHDFNAVFYSVVQVYNGFPLLVNNFTNTYGLYPHFVMPILKLTGLSILSFTTIMGIMLCSCFCFIYYFLNKVVQNKWILLFGFSAVFYICYFYGKIVTTYDPYFALYPIRWFFPTLLFAFSVLYTSYLQNSPNSFWINSNIRFLQVLNINWLKIIAYFVFSLGILWSPDFGTFTYLSLIAFFIYNDFEYFNLKKSIPKTFANIVLAIGLLIISFFTYSFIIKFAYGAFPDFSLMFSAIYSFSIVGYYMLPISETWHPWMLVALIYLIGWLISISNFINNKKTPVTGAIFMLSFLGTLSLSYFQGRSHNWNLFVTNPEFFLLITIFADQLYKISKSQVAAKIPFVVMLILIAFAPFQIIANTMELKKLIYTENDKRQNQKEQNKVKATAKIIDELCSDKEKIFILSADIYHGLYHNLSHTASFVNPGFIDIVTKKQYDHVVEELKSGSPKIFFEPYFYKPSNTKILNVLCSHYNLEDFDKEAGLYYYNKKKIDNTRILDSLKNTLFYNNFNIDFNKNLSVYEGSTPKINFPDQFTIEIIFKPNNKLLTNLNTNSILVSTFEEPKGFVIQQYGDKRSQYMMANKSGGIICNVNPNEWNYLVFEVNKEYIRCFVNGQYQNQTKMDKPFENSNSSIYIGSMKNQGAYFFGNIKEIKISKEFPNDVEIINNWNKVSKL